MSGSQHNPNGRQSQLGSGWSPLQVLQMANLLARAPQAHMASERGVTWHTPTPPPHLYHVPAPSPPDPLQAMKNASSNSVFRHTATPPELYRHTPTPPDKHMMRHTPSPGDVKTGPPMPPVDLYSHLGPARDKLVRAEELLAYARGVDLSLGSRANGAPPVAHAAALSVRDAPTINSLISRGGARRVDSLLERLGASAGAGAGAGAGCGAPASPHSVIMHGRAMPTPSPPSSNEDSADSFGAGVCGKRKRKPERTVRVPVPPLPPPAHRAIHPTSPSLHPSPETVPATEERVPPRPENGHPPPAPSPPPPADPSPAEVPRSAQEETPVQEARVGDDSTRRKTRSGSAETIAEIAAMIAGGGACSEAPPAPPAPAPLSVDKLQSVLASPEPTERAPDPPPASIPEAVSPECGSSPSRRRRRAGARSPPAHTSSPAEGPRSPPAAARSPPGGARSPSEARAADGAPPAEPAAAFVEVENQLEKMFAGLEEEPTATTASDKEQSSAKESGPASKRRKGAGGRGREAASGRGREAAPGRGREAPLRRKGPRKKTDKLKPKEREGYDSGSNASSGRSRGPYIQIVGPRASPVSVCVMNAVTGEEEEGGARRRGVERRRGLHASTLGLRYDAATRDLTWLCAFCGRPPHHAALGDLFGPYALDTDSAEWRALDAAARRAFLADGGRHEAWLHADCALWAPGVVAAGARVWGLARAVWAAAAERCAHCTRPGAPLACAARACPARAHLPCARASAWRLHDQDFRALCPVHRD